MEVVTGSWKTTLGGILSAIGLALVAAKDTLPAGFEWLSAIGALMGAVGVGFMGATAKDSTVHSTQTQVANATVEKAVEKKAAITKLHNEK